MNTELKYNSKKRVVKKYVTPEKLEKVNKDNISIYEQYQKTNIVRNKDVKDTTYKMYRSAMNQFMCYIMEEWGNFYLLDESYINENMIDVMEGYIAFCVEELELNKKTINFRIATVSSFYKWAVKRQKIKSHPFEGKLDRMKNVHDEKIIAEYFLTKEQVEEIEAELSLVDDPTYTEHDSLDRLMWKISFDSACRIGALSQLRISNFEYENMRFVNVREKRGKIVSVPVTRGTADLIKKEIDSRKIKQIDCDYIFYSIKFGNECKPMSNQTISRRIKKLGHIVGIGDFRPHCIRKTRLNMVAKHDINLAKALANHESLDTTSRFYTEKQDMSDVLQNIVSLEKE